MSTPLVTDNKEFNEFPCNPCLKVFNLYLSQPICSLLNEAYAAAPFQIAHVIDLCLFPTASSFARWLSMLLSFFLFPPFSFSSFLAGLPPGMPMFT